MDSRTQVNRQSAPVPAPPGGAVATQGAREPGTTAGATQQSRSTDDRSNRPTRRESVDPMRSTDRYRLVHPVNAGP